MYVPLFVAAIPLDAGRNTDFLQLSCLLRRPIARTHLRNHPQLKGPGDGDRDQGIKGGTGKQVELGPRVWQDWRRSIISTDRARLAKV